MADRIDESWGSQMPNQRVVLPLSDAARASLLAVRAAQEAARDRARRQTKRTRAWLGGIAGGIAVGLLVFGPRVGGHDAPAKAVSSSKLPESAPVAVVAVEAAPQSAPAASPSAEAVVLNAPDTPESSDAPDAPDALPDAAPGDDACSASFGQRRWRLSIEACTQAFQAQPKNAALALRIAHAHHARSRLAEAADWANRAIALDPRLPEAFVIVAHAHTRAGNPAGAVEAYRRYLVLAPRGWHATEARAAMRAHLREKHARMHPTTPNTPRTTAVSVAAAD
ncbi:MAG: hypothetical protein H7X95_10800 [Deltaproteobacteria bacterium]|nr:hypothetical protein [Deltaproteobacteria bacterium]